MYRSKKEIAFAGEVEQEFGFLETNPSQLTGTPDIYFADCKLAVFYHGCFWHSHHCKDRALSEDWHRKLLDIRNNDANVAEMLARDDIASLVVWECNWDRDKIREMRRIYDYRNLLLNYGAKLRKRVSNSSSAIVE